jgi:glycosyltransferase involved in cell wall biosynthesis
MTGSGELEEQVKAIAAADPARFRILPFQNQSRMPIVYRLGDLFVLPSSHSETWGLAVNEALACGRPVLVSDRVGCASDVVNPTCGRVFPLSDPDALLRSLTEVTSDIGRLRAMRQAASKRAWAFDVAVTEAGLVEAIRKFSPASRGSEPSSRFLSQTKKHATFSD